MTGTLMDGSQPYTFTQPFTVDGTVPKYTFCFTAPSDQNTITWAASATVAGDGTLDNNIESDETTAIAPN